MSNWNGKHGKGAMKARRVEKRQEAEQRNLDYEAWWNSPDRDMTPSKHEYLKQAGVRVEKASLPEWEQKALGESSS